MIIEEKNHPTLWTCQCGCLKKGEKDTWRIRVPNGVLGGHAYYFLDHFAVYLVKNCPNLVLGILNHKLPSLPSMIEGEGGDDLNGAEAGRREDFEEESGGDDSEPEILEPEIQERDEDDWDFEEEEEEQEQELEHRSLFLARLPNSTT
jgi:hypothetical protein